MASFLDPTGLARLWTDIKAYLSLHYGYSNVTGVKNITVGSGKNFATIQAALDSLPKNIGNQTVTITVDAGTFPEDVNILGFYGAGELVLIGAGSTGNPTTIMKSIYCSRCQVVLTLQNLKFNNTRIWSGTDTYACALQLCNYVMLENLIVTSAPTGSFLAAGNAVVHNAGNCIAGPGAYGVQVRHNSQFYAASSCDWLASGMSVRVEFGGRYVSSVLLDELSYSAEYGGSVITDFGLNGGTGVCGSNTIGNAANLNYRNYPALGLVAIYGSIDVKTGQTIAANTNVTVATIPAAVCPIGASRALATFVTGNGVLKGYVSNAGNIGIRSELSLAAGSTIYINGLFPIQI